MESITDFSGLYSLAKTLRMALIPQGRTAEHFANSAILEKDEHRAGSYVLVKKIIDRYHKAFIEKVLENFSLKVEGTGKKDSLEEFQSCYLKASDEKRKERLQEVQSNLRKKIASAFNEDDAFKRIDKKELITADLPNFVETEEERKLVEEFNNFTTYFTGFHENRRNMYSEEEKSTAIAYRVVNENLPRFIDNMNSFKKIASIPEMQVHFNQLYANFEPYLNTVSINELFELKYFNTVLSQKQIDVYNAIIGGKVEEDKSQKVKGLNEYINLYNQQHDREQRLPQLKMLFKQILSDRNAISWLPEEFKTDNELLEKLEQCYQDIYATLLAENKERGNLPRLLASITGFDLDKIYLTNDAQLTEISQKVFGNWSIIKSAIVSTVEHKRNEREEKYEERQEKFFKSQSCFSIGFINRCILDSGMPVPGSLTDYWSKLGEDKGMKKNLVELIQENHDAAKELLNTPYPKDKNLAQDKTSVAKIKILLDSLKALQHFIKPLLGSNDEADKDERFYGELSFYWQTLDAITLLYNKVRNRMTRKPYSKEKVRLLFEESEFLKGWDLDKEYKYKGFLMRRNEKYYLAIISNGKFKNILDSKKVGLVAEKTDAFEKLEYKRLTKMHLNFPRICFAKTNEKIFAPNEKILRIKLTKTDTKTNQNFKLEDCHAMIDYFKSCLGKYDNWKRFKFNLSDTRNYTGLNDFYNEVEKQGFSLSFRNIPANYIEKLVDEGKIYLFQIYNKDFSPYSKGTPNMHTLYWKMIFDERNLSKVVYRLAGGTQMFYRQKSISDEQSIRHPANLPIINKNPLNPRKRSLFEYELIKDRRYTVDKFLLNVPIDLNFKSSGNDNINQEVNQYIKEAKDLHVIGIDRGERHLLYLSLIDMQGRIMKQYSLNEIINEYKGQSYKTDYHTLLTQKEIERKEARVSWQTIENIKELKEGYLSQVIHKITQLMVEYNAIVVLEDLNQGFMRGRQKVERQVYQKFEKMLIDKLNYLVDKKVDADAPTGVLHALQLTNKFVSFQKLGKQSGFLFYVPAWNTSKIDPVTGFVNLFDTRYINKDKTKGFFGKFEAIRYNAEKDWFEFEFNYKDFTAKAEDTRTQWTVCTCGNRIRTFRNAQKNSQWDNDEVNLTEQFKSLFKEQHIDLTTGDIQQQILQQDSREFFESLLKLFKLTLQMRNSITNSDTDYLISPVADENGNFYCSDTCGKDLPENADANGAYNIARKGLWVISQIKTATDLSKLKLAISNKEWLQFVQQKPYLNK